MAVQMEIMCKQTKNLEIGLDNSRRKSLFGACRLEISSINHKPKGMVLFLTRSQSKCHWNTRNAIKCKHVLCPLCTYNAEKSSASFPSPNAALVRYCSCGGYEPHPYSSSVFSLVSHWLVRITTSCDALINFFNFENLYMGNLQG